MQNKLSIIGVMGSGKEDYPALTKPLGAMLASINVHLLTGGGQGVMAGVAKSFVETHPRKGLSLGVAPSENGKPKDGYPNPYIELTIQSPLGVFTGENPYQISRNHINIMTADALIFLSGSKGTLNELSLAVLFNKPFCLFGAQNQFENFIPNLPRFETIAEIEKWLYNL